MVIMADAASYGSVEEPYLIIIISLASVSSLVVVIVLCLCCYGHNEDDEEEDDSYDEELLDRLLVDKKAKPSVPPLSPGVRVSSQLSHQGMSLSKVQPELNHQWSVNRLLGICSPKKSLSEEAHSSDFDIETGGATFISSDTVDGVPVTPSPGLDFGDLGKIHFYLGYDFEQMTLNLKLICAENLPPKDFSGTSDPYVKIMLLPDKRHRLVSNIKRRNLNPRWNESFAFEGYPFSKLSNKILYMQVLDYDRFSRDDPIGEVCIPLSEVNLADGETLWRNLQHCKGHAGKLGLLSLSLCYQPTPGLISVGVIAARGLVAKDVNGLSDPYVKIWLMYDGKKQEKRKTQVKEKTLEPEFKETFVFNVPAERIRLTSLSVSVMDHDHIGQNELIGRVVLGSKSGPMEMKHWKAMIEKPRTTVEQWHVLKDFG